MSNHSRTLLLFQGESGSGKSTTAKKLVEEKGYVRLNRDEIRMELAPVVTSESFRENLRIEPAIKEAGVFIPEKFREGSGGRDFEDLVGKVQHARASYALKQDKSVIIDDTNLNPNTVDRWRKFSEHKASFEIYRMATPLEECILRDSKREGKTRVGRPVIERQFLMSGRHPVFTGSKFSEAKGVVIFDVDGTVASHLDKKGNYLRSPYGENVEVDLPWQPVIDEVNRYYAEGYLTVAVSGRKSTCGDKTVKWLEDHGVNFHAIFMRHAWDRRKDTLVKGDILRELTNLIPKESIVAVLDDRPSVVRFWMESGLNVRPVFGGTFLTLDEFTTEHREGCPNAKAKNYRRCPEPNCLALESF